MRRCDRGSLTFGNVTAAIDDDDPEKSAPFVAAFGPDGTPRWLTIAAAGVREEGCVGVAMLDGGTVVFATTSGGTIGGAKLPVGAVVALTDGKPTWIVSLPALTGNSAGSVEAVAQSGGHLFVTGVVKRRAVVVELDGATGALIGEPRWLGAMDPTAIAVDATRIVVVGLLEGPGTVAGQDVAPAGDADAIAVGITR